MDHRVNVPDGLTSLPGQQGKLVPKQLSLEPEVCALLKQGIDHHQAGRRESADACYRQALSVDSQCPQALHLLGLLAQQAGEYKKSVELIHGALTLDPDDADMLSSLAESALGKGDLDLARDCCRRIAELRPEHAKAHYRIGRMLERQGHWEDAGWSYRRAISLLRDSPDFHLSLARLQSKLGAFQEAVKSCRRALAVAPGNVEAYTVLGGALTEQGKYALALEVFRRALALKSDSAELLCGLGFLLQRQGNLPAAAETYRYALRLSPNLLDAHIQLGIIFLQQSNVGKAAECFARARELNPVSPDAAYRLGILNLLKGNFLLGWKEYEHRWGTPYGVRHSRRFRQNLWNGEPLQGSRIVLHAEQGMGDTLQFIRYLPMVAACGGRIVLEVQPRLHRLLARTSEAEKVIRSGEALPQFDWQCPLLSLPRIFATGLDTIPAQTPYVFADPTQATIWRERMGTKSLRVGLAWGGNPKHPHDLRRSIPLAQLAPLGNLAGAKFYSLQLGPAAAQIKEVGRALHIIDLQEEQQDFADTAAIVANLDLVISVDTSVAHLAGAMGRPVWVLLHKSPDWRWLLDREDSPWYPTARLFRQTTLGIWQDVVSRVLQELGDFVPARAALVDGFLMTSDQDAMQSARPRG